MTEKKVRFSPKAKIASEESAVQSNLADELEREKDARNEERFLFIVAFVVLFDAIIFSHVENWAGAIVIGIVELVGLAVLARKWRVQEVAQFLAMFFQRMADHTKPSNPSSTAVDGGSANAAIPEDKIH